MAGSKKSVPLEREIPIRTFGVERSFLRAASRLVDLVPRVRRAPASAASALAGDLWWVARDMRVAIAEAKTSMPRESEPSAALTPADR
jgi:hypothetical protein